MSTEKWRTVRTRSHSSKREVPTKATKTSKMRVSLRDFNRVPLGEVKGRIRILSSSSIHDLSDFICFSRHSGV